jgi:hypothetical protein
MPRTKLCRHCNEVRRELSTTQELDKTRRPKADRHQLFVLDRELAIAENMKRLCITSGNIVRRILDGVVTLLDLEEWFNEVADGIARKPRLHYNTATQLGWTFSPPQLQVLAYLFWQIFRVEWQYTRRNRADALYQRDLVKNR